MNGANSAPNLFDSGNTAHNTALNFGCAAGFPHAHFVIVKDYFA